MLSSTIDDGTVGSVDGSALVEHAWPEEAHLEAEKTRRQCGPCEGFRGQVRHHQERPSLAAGGVVCVGQGEASHTLSAAGLSPHACLGGKGFDTREKYY